MAIFRAHHGIAEDLPELLIQAFIGRTGMFLTVEESVGRENDENSPTLASTTVQERSAILRPSPRLPLQEISHLFPSNTLSAKGRTDNSRNATGVTDRLRRNPSDSPIHSKKRRIWETTSPIWDRLARPASKSARTCLRSFR